MIMHTDRYGYKRTKVWTYTRLSAKKIERTKSTQKLLDSKKSGRRCFCPHNSLDINAQIFKSAAPNFSLQRTKVWP